jgi:hypothetical protein
MQSEPEANECLLSLRIRNSHSAALTFYLEPWGEQYAMPPEATFAVVAKGPEGDSLEVEFADDHITLHGWPGSVVSLFHAGIELGAGFSERTPEPLTPPRQDK